MEYFSIDFHRLGRECFYTDWYQMLGNQAWSHDYRVMECNRSRGGHVCCQGKNSFSALLSSVASATLTAALSIEENNEQNNIVFQIHKQRCGRY